MTWITFDNIIWRVAYYDYPDRTAVLWGINGKTTRIPIYFLTNPGFSDALDIKFIDYTPPSVLKYGGN